MALQCEHCQRTFPTNASLYKHKHEVHNNSSLVLVNHAHKNMSDSIPSKPRTRNRQSDHSGEYGHTPKRSKIDGKIPDDKKDPQYDDGLVVVDKYSDPGEKPLDSDPKTIPPKYDPQNDDQLKVIDEYKIDDEDDDQLTVIDSYDDDGQSDDNLSIVDRYDDKDQTIIKTDYKKKYLDCLKAHKIQQAKFLKKISRINIQNKSNLDRHKKQMRDKCRDEIDKIKNFHQRQMSDLEELLTDKRMNEIKDLSRKHDRLVSDMKNDHRKELSDIERECQRKLKLLDDQIKAMEKGEEDLSSLSKAIFNCTTMEEIFQIQKLVNNHQLDDVIKNHLPTLQNLFLSLSYGILPICQPQRQQVTDEQRKVVERIQTASSQTAKKILQENRADITNLFTIIKNSIKLARDSYNRYGTS